MSINVVVLVGNAGRDPELRFFESGSCVCEFALAINRPPRDGLTDLPLRLPPITTASPGPAADTPRRAPPA